MGNTCSGEDQFNVEGAPCVPPGQEVYQPGQVPLLTQNPSYFNDDDPLDLPIANGPIRYSQAGVKQPILDRIKYSLQENSSIKIAAQSINQSNLALNVSLATKELVYRRPNGTFCPRTGIDLICVIDHSGSMAGQKEANVQNTLLSMLQFLQPVDRLCLIMFDCSVYRLTRLLRITSENIPKFQIAISAICAQGGTDIGNAMKMALSVIKHRRYRNPVTAILLLSDGIDEEAPEKVRSDLSTYNIREPFTIKTFGFGTDVCPRIMNEIAHMKEGQFYFVPNLSVIDECFAEALGGLVSVVANNVYITVQASGAQIVKAYGDKWQYDQWKGAYTLYQPHLLSGVRKDYVFEVQLPRQASQMSQLSIRIQLDPLDGSPQVILEETVQITTSIENQDQTALENYYRVKGAECFDQAFNAAEQGNYNEAQQLLLNMQQQIQLQHFNCPTMDMLQNDLRTTGAQCQPGLYETGGRHNLTQLHIVHMYQKSRGVQIVAYQNGQKVELPCAYQNNVQNDFKQQVRQQKLNYYQN